MRRRNDVSDKERLAPVLNTLLSAFDAFNKGDIARFRSTWANDVVAIINEAPPHVWVNDDPFSAWLNDSGRASPTDVSDVRIKLSRCLKAMIESDSAFIVLVVTMSWVAGGKYFEEDGVQISNLIVEDGVWKVRAAAYGGGVDLREADHPAAD